MKLKFLRTYIWHLTNDIWHLISGIWYLISDILHMQYELWQLKSDKTRAKLESAQSQYSTFIGLMHIISLYCRLYGFSTAHLHFSPSWLKLGLLLPRRGGREAERWSILAIHSLAASKAKLSSAGCRTVYFISLSCP